MSRLSKRDVWLLLLFSISAILLGWIAGDLIIQTRTSPDYRGAIVSPAGGIIWCTDKLRQWKPRSDGMCYDADAP